MDALSVSSSDNLAQRLLAALRPIASAPERPARQPGFAPRGRQLFSYCCFSTERLTRIVSAKPLIGIVLSGNKEFWLGGAGQRLSAGDVFVFPAGPEFDVVNIPAADSGLYETLIVEVEHVPEAVQHLKSSPRQPRPGLDMRVPLNAELVEALVHAAALLAASDHANALAEHRLAEVLLLLRKVPAASCIFETTLAARVGWLVLGDPARRWSATSIGRALGMAASTLRRKLKGEGTSLRVVLAQTRMRLAHDILARGEGNVTDAAAMAGYASRSHFGRRFRSLYGASPSAVRAGAGN
jgi:AraC-like DNA-binding protein